MTSDRTANDSQHLSCIEVADSQFLGFVKNVANETDAKAFQKILKLQFPHAAHIPYAWIASFREDDRVSGLSDDEEPPNSAGPILLEQLYCSSSSSCQEVEGSGLGMFVVRFFGEQLLGVTCGRLSQCYRSVSRLALHRYFHPDGTPQELDFVTHNKNESLYGLGAGDTELLLNVVDDLQNDLLDKVKKELEWGGFKGNVGEVLPRLQNMQADIPEVNGSNHHSRTIIPVYRYPGNYRGDEWETYPWGPTSKMICTAVEENLLVKQKMNHCVANLYRDGNDFIDHHSDKDLDLYKNGVIVSFSLGTERIMELKRRSNPKDVTRILLPRCSMLVLGPKTNAQFTHSILKQQTSNDTTTDTSGDSQITSEPRISLTFRQCTTIMDKRTGRLIGEGSAITKNWEDFDNRMSWENTLFILSFCFSSSFVPKLSTNSKHHGLFLTGLFGLSWWGFTTIRKRMVQNYEERMARAFFSRKSATGLKY